MCYRYYVLHGLIEKKVFFRISLLWILLIAQCLIEIFGIWYLEFFFGIIATIIFREEIIGIINNGLKFLKQKG